MKKIFRLLGIGLIMTLALSACEKADLWDFDYPKDVLCGGTWSGYELKLKGEWVDITRQEYKDLQFTISFKTDGTYYGTGYFGTGSGTYEAHGKTIKTYVDGEMLYIYTVKSMSGDIAEITMTSPGSTTSLEFRVKKK